MPGMRRSGPRSRFSPRSWGEPAISQAGAPSGGVRLSALRLTGGNFLVAASSGAPQHEAFTAYSRRWAIETLFGALKYRGFNFEDPHRTQPERIRERLALLALASISSVTLP